MTTKSTQSSSILLALFAAMAMGTGTAKAGYTAQVLTVPDLPSGDSLSVSQISSDGKLILLTAFNPTTYYTDACYVYDRVTRKVSTLPVDPDAVPGSETYAGINSLGLVVGNELSTTGTVPEWAATQGYLPFQAFAFDPRSGIYYNFNAARQIESGGINCQANGINDLGQIAGVYENGGGEQGFILANIRVEHIKQFYKTIDALPQGRIQMSPTFEGYTGGRTQPQGINILGDVVGYYTDANTVATIGTQAFVYDPKKGFTTLNIPGNVENQAYAINAEGVIVGATYNPAGTTYGDAFIYNHGKFTFYDYPGAVYTQLDGISDGGLMVGIYENEDGTYGAFTLTPN